jgi:hypothetical protein
VTNVTTLTTPRLTICELMDVERRLNAGASITREERLQLQAQLDRLAPALTAVAEATRKQRAVMLEISRKLIDASTERQHVPLRSSPRPRSSSARQAPARGSSSSAGPSASSPDSPSSRSRRDDPRCAGIAR